MDTPDKGRIPALSSSLTAPVAAGSCKSEESPFYNFINSLSPITPVKSAGTLQRVQLFKTSDFTSAIFTSPSTSTAKEAVCSSRDSFSEDGCYPGGGGTCKASVDPNDNSLLKCTIGSSQNDKLTCTLNKAIIDPPDNMAAQSVHVNTYSPDHNCTTCRGVHEDHKIDNIHGQKLFCAKQQTDVKDNSSYFPISLQRKHSFLSTFGGVPAHDWQFLVSGPSDLLIHSPVNEQQIANKDLKTNVEVVGNLESSNSEGLNSFNIWKHGKPLLYSFHESECCSVVDYTGTALGSEADFDSKVCRDVHLKAEGSCDNSDDNINGGYNDIEAISKSMDHHSISRRCLTFEGAAAPDLNASTKLASGLQRPVNSKGRSFPSCTATMQNPLCTLRSIGLHLNSLGSIPKGKLTPHGLSASRKTIPDIAGPQTVDKASQILLPVVGNELVLFKNKNYNYEDEHFLLNAEESCQESNKKKRRKSESSDGDACKRCSCKKSKCLKLYCECFAAGVYCSEPCACNGCFNKPIHEETVLSTRKLIESRNPLAFAPKVILQSDNDQEIEEDMNNTPASARHKRGCNCKKSNCLKKYCECYQGGVGCSESCRCDGCKNSFGAREGGIVPSAEAIDDAMGHNIALKEQTIEAEGHVCTENTEQLPAHVFPAAPSFDLCRSIVKSSAPRLKPHNSSLRLHRSKNPLTSDLLNPSSAVCSGVATVQYDVPDVLKGDDESPCTTVKRSSPNSKRVAPPCSTVGLLPMCRNGRKLILKSIPTFPCLSDVHTDHQATYSTIPENYSAFP